MWRFCDDFNYLSKCITYVSAGETGRPGKNEKERKWERMRERMRKTWKEKKKGLEGTICFSKLARLSWSGEVRLHREFETYIRHIEYIILLGRNPDSRSSVCYNRWFICLQKKNKTNEKKKQEQGRYDIFWRQDFSEARGLIWSRALKLDWEILNRLQNV